MSNDVNTILKKNLSPQIIKIVFSNGVREAHKAIVRPITIKNTVMWQIERFVNTQAFHENVTTENLLQIVEADLGSAFRNINIIRQGHTLSIRISKKGKVLVSELSNEISALRDMNHNREKQYILCEGDDIPPLRDLGIFDSSNRIIKSKTDKYKQINRFVEIIDDEFKKIHSGKLQILDFGCGKSYLTFIVYYYFRFIRHIEVSIVGYDLKEKVVEECNAIAQKYGYSDLMFLVGDISAAKAAEKIDVIITLHACDTATDYALYYAVSNKVKYIFSVPCCQHEINEHFRCADEFSILLEHGLIKERFATLLTDAFRCEILKQNGYEVDVIEFVDFSHTPKNLMIRAKKRDVSQLPASNHNLVKLLDRFNCSQKLYDLLCVGGVDNDVPCIK